jgi:hypothetical protein
MKKLIFVLSALLCVACGGDGSSTNVIFADSPVEEVTFADGSNVTEMRLSELANNDIFVVKYNLSNSDVAAFDAGSVSGVETRAVESVPTLSNDDFRPAVRRYHPNIHIPFKPSRKAVTLRAVPPTLESNKNFWVIKDGNVFPYAYEEITAVLKAIGDHCYIWAADDGDPETNDQISTATADAYQEMFDKLYDLETGLFGYERGGGDGGDGGIDGDRHISILLYDIDFDKSVATGTLGYFFNLDEYSRAELDAEGYFDEKTNEMEMFYMDAIFANTSPVLMYTTLAHEFQHMIRFNQVEDSEVWFNEMLSVTAEDLCAHPSINQNYDDLIDVAGYAPYFNSFYDEESYDDWDDEAYYTYAKTYMYGAYLMRNYGGAGLLNELSTNGYDGEDAIGAALYTLHPSKFTTDYKRNTALAFSRFGEALVFNNENVPVGANTLDKTVVSTFNGEEYHFPALNLWDYPQRVGDGMGPDIPQGLSNGNDIGSHGISISRISNVSGDYTLTFSRPNEENISIFVLVR